MPGRKRIPKKYQPPGFEILYEDRDVIVGNKAAGFLTVAARWNRDQTIHAALNQYVRKGSRKSRQRVYVVHRLDQHTTGVLVFARTRQALDVLKTNWRNTRKTYYAVVHGRLERTSGVLSSYLFEDDRYIVHSTTDRRKGELARTGYEVLREAGEFSLLKIDLLTGKKNQIRVHFADEGHPVVGDTRYGDPGSRHRRLALHAQAISFAHPFSGERLAFEAPVPGHFRRLVPYAY